MVDTIISELDRERIRRKKDVLVREMMAAQQRMHELGEELTILQANCPHVNKEYIRPGYDYKRCEDCDLTF